MEKVLPLSAIKFGLKRLRGFMVNLADLLLARLGNDFGLLQLGAESRLVDGYYDGMSSRTDVLRSLVRIVGSSLDTTRVYSPMFAAPQVDIPNASSWPVFTAAPFLNAEWGSQSKDATLGPDFAVPYTANEIFRSTAGFEGDVGDFASGLWEESPESRFLSAVDPALARHLPRRRINVPTIGTPAQHSYPTRLAYPPELLPGFRSFARAWLIAIPPHHHEFRRARDRIALMTILQGSGVDDRIQPSRLEFASFAGRDARRALDRGELREIGTTEWFGNLDCNVNGGPTPTAEGSTDRPSGTLVNTQAADGAGQCLRWHTCAGEVQTKGMALRYRSRNLDDIGMEQVIEGPPFSAESSVTSGELGVDSGEEPPFSTFRDRNPAQLGLLQRGIRLGVRIHPHNSVHEFGHYFMRRLLHRREIVGGADVVSQETIIYRNNTGADYAFEFAQLTVPISEFEGRFPRDLQDVFRQKPHNLIRLSTMPELQTRMSRLGLFGLLDVALGSIDIGFSSTLADTALVTWSPTSSSLMASLRADQREVLEYLLDFVPRAEATELQERFLKEDIEKSHPGILERTVSLFKGSTETSAGGNFEYDGLWTFFSSPGGNQAIRNRSEYEAEVYCNFAGRRAQFWDRVWMSNAINVTGVVRVRETSGKDLWTGGEVSASAGCETIRYTLSSEFPGRARMKTGGLHALFLEGSVRMPLLEFAFRSMVAAFGVTFARPEVAAAIPANSVILARRERIDGAQLVLRSPRRPGSAASLSTTIFTVFVTRLGRVLNETNFTVDGDVVGGDVSFEEDGRVIILLVRDTRSFLVVRMGTGADYFLNPSIVDAASVTGWTVGPNPDLNTVVEASFLSSPGATVVLERGPDIILLRDRDGRTQAAYFLLGGPTLTLYPIYSAQLTDPTTERIIAGTLVGSDNIDILSASERNLPLVITEDWVPDTGPVAVPVLLLAERLAPGFDAFRFVLVELDRCDRLKRSAFLAATATPPPALDPMPPVSVDGRTLRAVVGNDIVTGMVVFKLGVARIFVDDEGMADPASLAAPFVIAFQSGQDIGVLYGVYRQGNGLPVPTRSNRIADHTLLDGSLGHHSIQILAASNASTGSGRRTEVFSYECLLPPPIRDRGLTRSPWVYGNPHWLRNAITTGELPEEAGDGIGRLLGLCEQEVPLVGSLSAHAMAPVNGDWRELLEFDPGEHFLWMKHQIPLIGSATATGAVIAAPTLRREPLQADSVTYIYAMPTDGGLEVSIATEGGGRGFVDLRNGPFERNEVQAEEEGPAFSLSSNPRFIPKATEVAAWQSGDSLLDEPLEVL